MKTNSTRERLLASSMICGVAFLGLSATHAAAAAAAAAASSEVSEIVVTGSRIPQPNLTSVSPLSVVSDQEVKAQGATTIESVLQNLPSVVPEFNQGVDNGSVGTSTVSLRGLGSSRTLVLVNGYRLMPGDPITTAAPDLNNIPAAMVDRVEVVTGGASAVYGSDAVAGVVNFIMKRNFEGVRIDTTYSGAFHNNNNSADRANVTAINAKLGANNQVLQADNQFDAKSWDVTVLMGVNAPDGKGNITTYAGYRRIEPLAQSRRDYGACGISTLSSQNNNVYDKHVCQGSSNSAFGRFNTANADNPDGTNTFVPYQGAFAFNFGPFNYYQQDDSRYTAGYFAHYEVNPMFDVYSDLMFSDDRQVSQAAPSGLFSNSGGVYSINCANPFMSAQQQSIICGPGRTLETQGTNTLSTKNIIAYRFKGVPRVTDFEHVAYTISLGTQGKLNDTWSYDLHAQFGHTQVTQKFTGDVSIRKINDALNAVAGPNGPVCVSGNTGCVPLNIFKALAQGFTPEAVAYVLDPASKAGYTEERIVSLNVTGDLGPEFKSPWAKDNVGVNLGAEYRSERINLSVSSNYASGDLSGAGGVNPPASGGYDVYELFGEARVPVIQDMPFIENLSVELGYRFSDYNLAGTTNTYKISGDWTINSDIRLRGGYNRAVRAPNIIELFGAQIVGNGSFNDPCAGATPGAGCASTFASPALASAFLGKVVTCPAGQCSQLTGGNLALKPEQADTYTVGFVVTPGFLPGFNASVDYFDIKLDSPIQAAGIGSALIVNQCRSFGRFCEDIHRDPTSGNLFGITKDQGYVISTAVNSGSIRTKGIDIAANYRRDIGSWGSLAFQMLGTWTDSFVTEPVNGLGSYDCAGFYGPVCLEPTSKWKHQARVTWTTPWESLGLSANWRHLSEVKLDLNQSNDPFLASFGPGVTDTIESKIKAYDYFDLSANYKVRNVMLRIGVNNVFDKDPPTIDANNLAIAGTTAFGNGNTFPGVYDTLGRTVFVGATADF